MVIQKKHKRMAWVVGCAALLTLGAWMVVSALSQNSLFFYNASDVAAEGFTPESDIFRVGGMVVEGSVVKSKGVTTTFQIADFERPMARPLTVSYAGALPDLFREGEGVVVSGRLITPTEIQASEVLAKHDENYQPKITYQDERS
ncbi:cytochrome c maturation protein CcmE [Litorimonas sp. RW-G-Af-16]|uniref:cytochrome c maturation protein CcmE n=1 Tax=Litorimonas sp. RW-G-Af-16 TaxID=3241168 RepID=UPI00390C7F3C